MLGQCITKNEALIAWVKEMTELCQPTNVHWCDGSEEEYQYLCDLMVKSGTFVKLNELSARIAIWRVRIRVM